MTAAPRTWLVMLRDVSDCVEVDGESTIHASLILDADTGLILGTGLAAGRGDALAHAAGTALTERVGPVEPGVPERIVCGAGLGSELATALGTLRDDLPPVVEARLADEAEDIFDSMVGHLSGWGHPEEPAITDDWRLAFDKALAFRAREPWQRWEDVAALRLELRQDGEMSSYTAFVLGGEGIQYGLSLCPGTVGPGDFIDGEGGSRAPVGTLMCFLDPPGELPSHLRAKALRYGWPEDADVVAAFVVNGADGPIEPSGAELGRLAAGLAAVLAHDQRGPVLVGDDGAWTSGELVLGDGEQVSFRVGGAGG